MANMFLKKHLHHGTGIAGTIGGAAAVPSVVTWVGGAAAASGITGGLATLGGGTMLAGITAVSCIPVAAGLVGLGVGYVVKRAIWG